MACNTATIKNGYVEFDLFCPYGVLTNITDFGNIKPENSFYCQTDYYNEVETYYWPEAC